MDAVSTCEIPVVPAIHPAVLRRHSPMAFEPGAEISDDALDTILDAGRLAPSAGNSQPWAFVVGRHGDAVHARIVRHLAGSSARWAPDASAIVVNLARVLVEDTDWEYSEFSRYDLGQAVAHMTLQALSIGIDAHQFRAFDREAVAAEFAVPREWEVTSMTAFGVAAHAAGTVAGVARERRSRGDVTWTRVRADEPR
ncbi:Oxygen-insensitive NAD(P)H nitroreductase (plasmid) [Tsukamurella tyrosinosolvens]|uniref:Nitroreductase n=1 Tax=Tsukamurella tyrosinosolvens TaxID=57704 RepID=A0A1H4XMK6_TSUTY|nr:nitroreductase [Tsukamurella tyrosinosolvens]SED06118.1 Nitroreductase [Tsukamurella tyrosinosolvens]VEH98011.1 Oxygen-insensitive NAD(P)H nitroreductase [Tsukamurella tyrosinosolvens]